MATNLDTLDIIQYRCKTCNAPFPLGADDVISTCPYCGYTFEVDSGEIREHHMIPNKLEEIGATKVALNWLKVAGGKAVGARFIKDIEMGKPALQWIPAFRVEASCETYHFGAKEERDGNQKTWHRIEGSSHDDEIEWVLARRYAAAFGIAEFMDSLQDAATEKFKIKGTGDAPVLNAELDEVDAPSRAKQQKAKRDRSELKTKMTKLLDYRLNLESKNVTYVHAPYWLLRYDHRGGTFRIAISGATGQVVLGELPVTKRYRIKKWFTATFMLVVSALLFQVLPYILYALFEGSSSDSDVFVIPVAMLLLAIILWAGSYSVVGGVLKYEIQMTARGEERSPGFTIDDAIENLRRRF
ncbi:MAG: hypothetical protein EAX95_08435 [Candidatus Thorarchaeota archaeon]|nr:hypothetical protein [Candidatus Thorarchaeota archaeon]